jgi:hypothetical protein
MYLLCVNVGPMCLVDFSRTRRSPRLEAGVVGGPPADKAERILRWVEHNLTALIRIVPMEEIEDRLPSMQPHVVWVPRTWVHLFRRLENFVVDYGRANRPCP